MKNRKNIIMITMCVLMLVMAVGYAAFSTSLKINGSANISSSWSVLFTNIEEVSKTKGIVIKEAAEASGTTATFNVGLTSPGDVIEYKITVANQGTIDAVIDAITISDTGSDAIVFEVTGIEKGDTLSNGETTTFNVKISYKDSITQQPNVTTNKLTVNVTYVQNFGQSVNVIPEEPICTIAADSTVEAGEYGAKYNCKVDPNKDSYTFYLLDNNADGTSDLIMNANINASGEAVIPGVTEDTGLLKWNGGNSIVGPETSMTYLHNATKSWTNVEPLNYSYYDREVQGITSTFIGYESFISVNGISTITKGYSGGTQLTIGTEEVPLRARLPIYSSDSNVTEVTMKSNASYLYENLNASVKGYWTMSSYDGTQVQVVAYAGAVLPTAISNATTAGVRPVITVKL